MYNPIGNLGPLVDMAALEQLWLYESDLASLQPLAGLTALRMLVIQSNAQPPADLTPPEDLASLTTFSLSGCHINDLDGLDGLIGPKTLVLSHNDIVSDVRTNLSPAHHAGRLSQDGYHRKEKLHTVSSVLKFSVQLGRDSTPVVILAQSAPYTTFRIAV